LPPTYRVELVAARAVAWAPALAVKPATGAPVVRLMEAILRLVTALTPPPPKVGRNPVSISPVL
jgi:hypothetical protein